MLKKTLTALAFISLLPGCTSILANTTAPGPMGAKPGERTMSMRVEDMSIENTASVNIYKADPALKEANINVISFYGAVLLVGQVPSDALKQKAEQIVRQIAEVKQVHNELTVSEPSYYWPRTKDSVITTRINSSLIFDETFPSSRSKITTSNGVVYLLGKLTPAEADKAVATISKVGGVQKIVKFVDYLPADA